MFDMGQATEGIDAGEEVARATRHVARVYREEAARLAVIAPGPAESFGRAAEMLCEWLASRPHPQ